MSDFDFALIGLSGRDKRVYEALLQIGNSSIRSLADHVAINRGSVHESLQNLNRAGLVGFVSYGERKRYIAQDPLSIEQMVAERQAELQQAKIEAKLYARQLVKHTTTVSASNMFATSYEGDEGLASILRDVIATLTQAGHNSYEVISSPILREYLYNNFRTFTRERIRQQLFVHVIAIGNTQPTTDAMAERRVMRLQHQEAIRSYTILYADKTALISLSDTNEPQGIVLTNPGLTALQREQFWQLWSIATPLAN